MDPEAQRAQYKADLAKVEEKLPLYRNVENAEALKQLLAIKAHFTAQLEALGPGPEAPPPFSQRDPIALVLAEQRKQERADDISMHPEGRDKPAAPFFPGPGSTLKRAGDAALEAADSLGASAYRTGNFATAGAFGAATDALGELQGSIHPSLRYSAKDRQAQQAQHPAQSVKIGGADIPLQGILENTAGGLASAVSGPFRWAGEGAAALTRPLAQKALQGLAPKTAGQLAPLVEGGLAGGTANAMIGAPGNLARNANTPEEIIPQASEDFGMGAAFGAGIPALFHVASKLPGWGGQVAGKVGDFIRGKNRNIRIVEDAGGQIGVRGIKNGPAARAGLEATPAGQGEAGTRASKALHEDRGLIRDADAAAYKTRFNAGLAEEGSSTKISTEALLAKANEELSAGNVDPAREKLLRNFVKVLTENGRMEPVDTLYITEPHGGGTWGGTVGQVPPRLSQARPGGRRFNLDTGQIAHPPQFAPRAPSRLVDRYTKIQRPSFEDELQVPLKLEAEPLDIPPLPSPGQDRLLAGARRTMGAQPEAVEPAPVSSEQDSLLAAARATAGAPLPTSPALPTPAASVSPLRGNLPATMAVPTTVSPPPVPQLRGQELVGPSVSAGGGSLMRQGVKGVKSPDAAPGAVLEVTVPMGDLTGRVGDDPNHYLDAATANRFKVQYREMARSNPAAADMAEDLMNLVDEHAKRMSAANKGQHQNLNLLENTEPLMKGEGDEALGARARIFGDERSISAGGQRPGMEKLLNETPVSAEMTHLWPELSQLRPPTVTMDGPPVRGVPATSRFSSNLMTRDQLREKFDLPRQILAEQRLQLGGARPAEMIAGGALGGAAGMASGHPLLGSALGAGIGAFAGPSPYTARLAYPAARGLQRMGPGGESALQGVADTAGTGAFPALIPPMTNLDIDMMIAEAQRKQQEEAAARMQMQQQMRRQHSDRLFQPGEGL